MQIVGSELARESEGRIACKQASYTVNLTISLLRVKQRHIE
jgi:hypothetical protein